MWIDPEALAEMVFRTPNLKHLIVKNCIFITAVLKKADNPAEIIMPNTSLDTLSLVWSGDYTGTWDDRYAKLQLKVVTTSSSTGNRPQYYGLD